MNDMNVLPRLFRQKALADARTASAMQGMDAGSPATEVALRVLGHVYVVDRIFAAHLTGSRHGQVSANPAVLPPLETLARQLRDSDRWYIDYSESLEPATLAEQIDFEFTDGEPGRMSREEMLMHVLTHGIGHRGQLGWMMTLGAVTPPADGFASYLHEAEPSTRRRPASSGRSPVAQRSRQWPAPFATLAELTHRLRFVLSNGGAIGRPLKFDLADDGVVVIEDTAVTNDDKPTALTLRIAVDDLQALCEGRLALAGALASGRLVVSDMGMAFSHRSEIETLLARLR